LQDTTSLTLQIQIHNLILKYMAAHSPG